MQETWVQETWVRALGQEDLLEKGRLPTPAFSPGGPWTEQPGGLQASGSQELDMTEGACTHALRRECELISAL